MSDRQPGEIRPRDRVITSGRRREIGYVVAIDGDTAQVMFVGLEDKTWPYPLAKLTRHWDVRREWTDRGVRISARHPSEGHLYRGAIRSAGIRDYAMVWSVVTYEHEWSEVVGDFLLAERTLLEATAELDGEPSLTAEAAAILARSGREHAHNPDPQRLNGDRHDRHRPA